MHTALVIVTKEYNWTKYHVPVSYAKSPLVVKKSQQTLSFFHLTVLDM